MSRTTLLVAGALVLAACSGDSADGSVESAEAVDPARSTSTSAVAEGWETAESTSPPSQTEPDTTLPSPASTVQCGGAPVEPEEFEYASIDGVEPDLLSVDVYSTSGASSCPLVIYVHGGSWQAGDKRTQATRVKADHFVDAGYVFASINYRLVAADNGVRWPAPGRDVAAAVDWLIDHASEFGVDPDRVSLIGHSAGAHLVSIVGTNPDPLGQFDQSLGDLACIVSLDTLSYDLTTDERRSNKPVQIAFEDDESKLLAGSPLLQVRSLPAGTDIADFLVVTRGSARRLDASREFSDTVALRGGRSEYFDASPYSHREVSVELGEPDETVITPVVTDFLASC